MKIDSVRELKMSLAARLLPKAVASVRSFSAARTVTPRTASAPSVALGIAPKGRGGYVLAVRIQQRALEGSRIVETIMKQAKGEVELRYIGRVAKRSAPWHQRRQRPLRIGCSVGHLKVTAGTLGGFVRPRAGGELAILSNNHVLANENRAKAGDAIVQPGTLDGGVAPRDTVATLSSFPRLRRSGANLVDCAMAEITPGIAANVAALRGLGRLRGLGDAFLDEGAQVAKLGRTTGLTRGRVTAFELDEVYVSFETGILRFDGCVEIEGAEDGAFSDGGDSGSLIVDGGNRAVALLFAGSDQGGANGQGLTYANPIRQVLDVLKADLVY